MNVFGKQSWKRPEHPGDDDLLFATLDPEGERWSSPQTGSYDSTSAVPYWVIVEVVLCQEQRCKTRWFTARFDSGSDALQSRKMSPVHGSGTAWNDLEGLVPPTTSTVSFGDLGDVTVTIGVNDKLRPATTRIWLKPFVIRSNSSPTQGDVRKKLGSSKFFHVSDQRVERSWEASWDKDTCTNYIVVARSRSILGIKYEWFYATHKPVSGGSSRAHFQPLPQKEP